MTMTNKEFADRLRQLADQADPPSAIRMESQSMSMSEAMRILSRANDGKTVSIHLACMLSEGGFSSEFSAFLHDRPNQSNGIFLAKSNLLEQAVKKCIDHVNDCAAEKLASPVMMDQVDELVDQMQSPF